MLPQPQRSFIIQTGTYVSVDLEVSISKSFRYDLSIRDCLGRNVRSLSLFLLGSDGLGPNIQQGYKLAFWRCLHNPSFHAVNDP
jgi:hypothetical protein